MTRVVASAGCGLVASAGHGPIVRGECIPEVDTRPIPKSNQKIRQGLEAKITIRHIS